MGGGITGGRLGGSRQSQDPLHVEAVAAFLEGADRGVGERAAGDDRRLALDQRRRPGAERALGGGVEVQVAQFGGPLGRGQVEVHRDLRGGKVSSSPGRGSGGGPDLGDGAVRGARVDVGGAAVRRRSAGVLVGHAASVVLAAGATRQRLDQPLDHRRPRFHLLRRLRFHHAAEDQALARAGRGDVEEAQALLGVARLACLDQLAVVVEVDRRRVPAAATAGPPGAAARVPGRGPGAGRRPAGRGRGRGRRRPRTRGPWRCGRS